jgi:hypothetical protein
MTQKIQQLQEAIREVCTELNELTFGCQGKDSDGLWTKTYQGWQLKNGFSAFPPDEIIGHPIQLQHILRAMNEKGSDEYVIDTYGIVRYQAYNDDYRVAHYKLELPIDQQSPEVIDFLHSIICKA